MIRNLYEQSGASPNTGSLDPTDVRQFFNINLLPQNYTGPERGQMPYNSSPCISGDGETCGD